MSPDNPVPKSIDHIYCLKSRGLHRILLFWFHHSHWNFTHHAQSIEWATNPVEKILEIRNLKGQPKLLATWTQGNEEIIILCLFQIIKFLMANRILIKNDVFLLSLFSSKWKWVLTRKKIMIRNLKNCVPN